MKKPSNQQGSQHNVVSTSHGYSVSVTVGIGKSSTAGQASVSQSISRAYSTTITTVTPEKPAGEDVE